MQFGVTQALVGQYVRHEAGEPAPDADVTGTWHSLEHRFTLEPGEPALPPAPIRGKADGPRPTRVELARAVRA